MWSGWMNRFVATATNADGERVAQREVRLSDLLAEDVDELERDDLRHDEDESEREPGDSNPVRF